MILNGIDLVNINRFNTLKNKMSFMNKVFTKQELEYIKKHNNDSSTIAGIYASKEAFLKAIQKGINNYSLKDIEVIHNSNQAPILNLHNKDFTMYKNISLSIAHDGDYVVASVQIID